MATLLLSNLKPVSSDHDTFTDVFEDLFLKSEKVNIAIGYVSVQSLISLEELMGIHNSVSCELIVGMYGKDGISKSIYQALKGFNEFALSSGRAKLDICTAFPFHGKIYSFQQNQQSFASIVGSSNLSNVVKQNPERIYEVDVLVDEQPFQRDVQTFIESLSKATNPFDRWSTYRIIPDTLSFLDGHIGVEKISQADQLHFWQHKTNVSFEIPLKTEEKSNLNVYFGKGRLSTKTGIVRNRPWYEVELIVSKSITSQSGYPANRSFTVITDDGWKFKCKTSGDFSKNFRSEDDLQTLGKWIKGRLENDGVLNIKQIVDDKVLSNYGRNSITLTATDDPDVWLLDFSKS